MVRQPGRAAAFFLPAFHACHAHFLKRIRALLADILEHPFLVSANLTLFAVNKENGVSYQRFLVFLFHLPIFSRCHACFSFEEL